MYGIKVADLKKLQKKIGINKELALQLYRTGIYEGMYLAGMITDPTKMTKKELQEWVNGASAYMISEYTVPQVTAETPYALELALSWIDSEKELIASAGWMTINNLLGSKKELELSLLKSLLARVTKKIHSSLPRVRSAMNKYVIALGGYCEPLLENALDAAKKIGPVSVPMPGTSCKVPDAQEYIKKIHARRMKNLE